jgi:hypothetical protein
VKLVAYLKPGGFFYIAEGHPFIWLFDEKSPDLKIGSCGYLTRNHHRISRESLGRYMGHPFMWLFDEKSPDLKIGYPYFSHAPIKDEASGTYAELSRVAFLSIPLRSAFVSVGAGVAWLDGWGPSWSPASCSPLRTSRPDTYESASQAPPQETYP